MKQCPCCDKNSLNDDDVMNSVSHIGNNKTHICNDCGKKESFIHLAPDQVDDVDLAIYNRWKTRCEK
jgi:hypothetical protein